MPPANTGHFYALADGSCGVPVPASRRQPHPPLRLPQQDRRA
jgi:hypothetical protein